MAISRIGKQSHYLCSSQSQSRVASIRLPSTSSKLGHVMVKVPQANCVYLFSRPETASSWRSGALVLPLYSSGRHNSNDAEYRERSRASRRPARPMRSIVSLRHLPSGSLNGRPWSILPNYHSFVASQATFCIAFYAAVTRLLSSQVRCVHQKKRNCKQDCESSLQLGVKVEQS